MAAVAEIEMKSAERSWDGMDRVIADASGNFLFTNPPTGQQVLLVDGPSALYPGSLPVQMTIQPGLANVLPYPVFLHEVSQNYFPIAQGGQTIIAPPDIPGFTMLIPAGTTITGWDGQPNMKVSVVPVPNDRLPIPTLPANVPAKQVYMFNFGKPGGGYPSRPIPIIMPNDSNAAPGTRMDMWYYDEGPTPDPTSHQWKVYGQGTVSADGKSVIPDPGVGQPKFCCGGGASVPTGGGSKSAPALPFFAGVKKADPRSTKRGQVLQSSNRFGTLHPHGPSAAHCLSPRRLPCHQSRQCPPGHRGG